jgi:hypothetical protein
MVMPPLSGYPVDRAIIRRTELERRARIGDRAAARWPRRWLGWLMG